MNGGNQKKQIGVALAIGGILTSSWLYAAESGDAGGESSWWSSGKKLLESVTGSGSSTTAGSSALANEQIYSALKEALKVAADTVTTQLGTEGGYNKDPAIHIELPGYLQTVRPAMEAAGAGAMLDDLELKLNRAAEAAAPEAQAVFWQSIEQMTLDDARSIYEGADDAATRYFQKTMTEPLKERMRPLVTQSMQEVGLVQAYDNVMGEYKSLPFVPDVKTGLTDYVLEQGLNGMFHYMAEEEAAIRNNPAKQTTELLKKVFGASD